MTESEWRVLATYASGFEADLAMAQLEAAEIPAIRDSNDSVGILVRRDKPRDLDHAS